LWHRLQPVCLSRWWKPRISIRGSTPSGVRKKGASTRRASAEHSPACGGQALPTITIAATGKSDNGATALTRTPVAEVYPEVRGEPRSQIPIPIGKHRGRLSFALFDRVLHPRAAPRTPPPQCHPEQSRGTCFSPFPWFADLRFVSGHGFSRAVSRAKSIPPLGAEGFCAIGFSLCAFPVGGSPGFQPGGARLQFTLSLEGSCRPEPKLRRASAPALRPVAQPFVAVLRRSPSLPPGNPITEQLVSGHGFSRAVSLAKSIPPLGPEGFVA